MHDDNVRNIVRFTVYIAGILGREKAARNFVRNCHLHRFTEVRGDVFACNTVLGFCEETRQWQKAFSHLLDMQTAQQVGQSNEKQRRWDVKRRDPQLQNYPLIWAGIVSSFLILTSLTSQSSLKVSESLQLQRSFSYSFLLSGAGRDQPISCTRLGMEAQASVTWDNYCTYCSSSVTETQGHSACLSACEKSSHWTWATNILRYFHATKERQLEIVINCMSTFGGSIWTSKWGRLSVIIGRNMIDPFVCGVRRLAQSRLL